MRHALLDQIEVAPSPVDRGGKTLLQPGIGDEAEFLLRFCRIAVASSGTIPVAEGDGRYQESEIHISNRPVRTSENNACDLNSFHRKSRRDQGKALSSPSATRGVFHR